MGANGGTGLPPEPLRGLLSNCADSVLRYNGDKSKKICLQRQPGNVFEGSFTLNKEGKLLKATLRLFGLFSKKGPTTVLDVEETSECPEKERYQIVLSLVKKKEDRIIFANESILFGSIELEVCLFDT